MGNVLVVEKYFTENNVCLEEAIVGEFNGIFSAVEGSVEHIEKRLKECLDSMKPFSVDISTSVDSFDFASMYKITLYNKCYITLGIQAK